MCYTKTANQLPKKAMDKFISIVDYRSDGPKAHRLLHYLNNKYPLKQRCPLQINRIFDCGYKKNSKQIQHFCLNQYKLNAKLKIKEQLLSIEKLETDGAAYLEELFSIEFSEEGLCERPLETSITRNKQNVPIIHKH